MIITYYGLQFLKIQQGDLTIAYNPTSKKSASKAKPPHFGADIALVSLNHPDFNGIENLSHGGKNPFVVSGPGEYERRGISVRGYTTKSHYGGEEERINTLYTLEALGIKLCFAGAIDVVPDDEIVQEAALNADIFFVPIGDKDVFSPERAYAFASSLEPKIIIPIHYAPGGENSLRKFLKEAGEEKVKPLENFIVKKSDLDGKEGDVVVLEAQ